MSLALIRHLLSSFHLRTMAKNIDGVAIAQSAFHLFLFILRSSVYRSVRDGVADRIKSLQCVYPRFKPQLVIIQAGARPDSSVYVRMKAKAAEEVGIKFKHITLPADAAVDEVVETVKKLNDDDQTSGILVQLPLGDHVDANGERRVTEAVSPEKDVDGCGFIVVHS